jgi:hypothetical protein
VLTRRFAAATVMSAVLGVCVCLTTDGSDARAATSSVDLPGCSSMYNPYQYSAAFDQSCGDTVYPLISTTSRSDGGSDYNYESNEGASIPETIPIPPPGFNPLTASPAQQAAYGIPPEPTDASQQATWTTEVSGLHWEAPPPFLVVTQTQAPVMWSTKTSWGGYDAEQSGGNWNTVSVGYDEPTIGQSCNNSAEVIFAGLGGLGWLGDTIIEQDGTAWGVGGLSAHQAWWEIYPQVGIEPMNLVTSPNDLVDATTDLQGSLFGYPVFQFTVTDYTTGATQSVLEAATGGDSLNSAEGVLERPGAAGQSITLANVGTVYFWPVTADGNPINDYNTRELTLVNSSDTLAQPSGFSSSSSYSVQWERCS